MVAARPGRPALAVVAALVPLGGLGWWLTTPDNALTRDAEQAVPVYMQQSSLLGQEHGVLVLGGSVDDGHHLPDPPRRRHHRSGRTRSSRSPTRTPT